MSVRSLSPFDRLLSGLERAMEAVAGSPEPVQRSPGDTVADAPLSDDERRHAAGLMRINHVGEVCAQALYVGQAALARTDETRQHLMHAAQEETDHLAWCAERLKQLDSRPSLLNPSGTREATPSAWSRPPWATRSAWASSWKRNARWKPTSPTTSSACRPRTTVRGRFFARCRPMRSATPKRRRPVVAWNCPGPCPA